MAGLEGHDRAGRDGQLLPGMRVPARTRFFAPDIELAEAADLDILAAFKRSLDQIERLLDQPGAFLLAASEFLVNSFRLFPLLSSALL